MTGERRRRLQDEITDEARAGLDQLAFRHGVTRTAMLEALGLHAQDMTLPQRIVDVARRIDRRRRSRR